MVESKKVDELNRSAKVAVVIPCYNHQDYVEESIRSVMDQTYPNIELFVIDDCSKDNTVSIVEKLQDEYGFVFIKHESNIGAQRTAKEGVEIARGDYLQLCASDDVLLPNKILEQYEYIMKNNLDGVYSNSIITYKEGKEYQPNLKEFNRIVNSKKVLRHLYTCDTNGPLIQSGLFKMYMMKEVNHIRDEVKSDDWAIAIKIFEKYNIGFLDKPMFRYRIHGDNAHKDYWATFPMRVEVIAKYTPDKYKLEALANIMESMAGMLFQRKKYHQGIRFYISSFFLHFSYKRVIRLIKYSVKLLIRNR